MQDRFRDLGNVIGYRISDWLISAFIILCLAVMSYGMVKYGIYVGVAISLAPLFLILLLAIIKKPFLGIIFMFFLNYFLIAFLRYSHVVGLSVLFDGVIFFVFLVLLINTVWKSENTRKLHINGLIIAAIIWFVFCCLETLNPRAMYEAWIYSRGLTYYFLLITLLTLFVFKTFDNVRTILYVLSIFTLLGVAKGVIQQVYGFDNAEMVFLFQEEGAKTHLLATGTRYFSFYASAGIYGSVMGHALVVFSISAIYIKGGFTKIYFFLVAIAALYGMMISGTRGALAVPLAGYTLFIVLSKKIRVMIPSLIILISSYSFLAFTRIGQSNGFIRRMRTAFDPEEPSLVVRKENQALFREYLQDKPFGEGIGLSGVDAQDMSERFTTSIPTDSWYVKILVETGIVGLCLHIAIFAYVVIYGSYLIFFKIKNEEVRGIMAALLCGVLGILATSYGNQVLGQYPVALIIYMSMALVFMGPYFDKQITDEKIVKH